MTNKRRQWWRIGLLACVVVLLVVGLVFTLFRSGIHVTIQNTGGQPLRSVVLHVSGATYNLGDIAPGATANAMVHPTGESHLEIQFTDGDGQDKRLDAGGYFEPGYRGTINVSIKDGVIQENEQKISLRWLLPYTSVCALSLGSRVLRRMTNHRNQADPSLMPKVVTAMIFIPD